MIIAAAGYVINDIIDYKIDAINKDGKQIVGNTLSLNTCHQYYYGLLTVGAVLAISIAYLINNLALFAIYPIASFLLYGYSQWWKKQAWIGNIVVSLFTALVPFILLFAERDFVLSLTISEAQEILTRVGGFMLFAFILNLIREIVKDMEDLKGDRAAGYRTAAITHDVSTIKAVCYTLILISAISAIGLCMSITDLDMMHLFLMLLLIALLFLHVLITVYIFTAQAQADYKRVSTFIKIAMLVGLILFIYL